MAITLSDLLMASPRLEVQLCLVSMQAAFWFFFMPWFGQHVAQRYIDSKPYRHQFAALSRKTFKSSFFIDFDTETAYEFACLFLAIMVQHGVGGLLCVPALVPALGVPAHVATALACHGALCEAGWELQDILSRLFQVCCTKEGARNNPTALLVILGIHHTMGLSMVIPMNMAYPSLYWYHEGIFLLQFAACVALMAQNYGYTLDIGTRGGLAQMKATVTLVMLTMGYSRGLRYVFVGAKLLHHFRAQGDTRMLVGGAVGIGFMSLLNILFILDCSSKFVKFIAMKAPTTKAEQKMVRGVSTDFLSSLSPVRHPESYIELSASKRSWARLRGAQRMGVLRRPSEGPSEASTEASDAAQDALKVD